MQLSYEEIEGVLADGAPDELLAPARREIEGQIRQQVEKAYLPSGGAWRFEKAKAIAAAGQLALVRPVGAEQLFLADMPNDIRVEMEKTWASNWN